MTSFRFLIDIYFNYANKPNKSAMPLLCAYRCNSVYTIPLLISEYTDIPTLKLKSVAPTWTQSLDIAVIVDIQPDKNIFQQQKTVVYILLLKPCFQSS